MTDLFFKLQNLNCCLLQRVCLILDTKQPGLFNSLAQLHTSQQQTNVRFFKLYIYIFIYYSHLHFSVWLDIFDILYWVTCNLFSNILVSIIKTYLLLFRPYVLEVAKYLQHGMIIIQSLYHCTKWSWCYSSAALHSLTCIFGINEVNARPRSTAMTVIHRSLKSRLRGIVRRVRKLNLVKPYFHSSTAPTAVTGRLLFFFVIRIRACSIDVTWL